MNAVNVLKTYRIITSGPILTKNFPSIAAARTYVERYASLKRGWTGEWVGGRGRSPWVYVRSNSKGNALPASYNVVVRLATKTELAQANPIARRVPKVAATATVRKTVKVPVKRQRIMVTTGYEAALRKGVDTFAELWRNENLVATCRPCKVQLAFETLPEVEEFVAKHRGH